jgi:predicted MFS family arabinose efflux permease
MRSTLTRTINLYRDSYSGHPKEVWILAILTFINRFGTMVFPFITVYLTTVLGFSLEIAGIIASAFGIGSLIGSYAGGRLSDTIGPNPVILVSFIFSGIFFIILQWATSFWSLFGLILVAATFGEAYRPAVTTAIGQYVPKHQTGRSIALIRLAINLGMTAAPALGGFIAVSMGYGGLFWIDGVTCLLAAVYLAAVSWNGRKRIKEEPEIVELPEKEETVVAPFRNSQYMIYLLATLIMSFAFMQWFYSVPVFIKDEWGYDERYIGVLMALNCVLIVLIEMPAIHAIEMKQLVKKFIVAGLILIGLCYLPFLFPGALIWCLVSALLFSLGEIFYLPFNNSIAINMSPAKRRGDYMAWYWMTWSMSKILAPTIGLGFIGFFGYESFWVVLGVLTGISLWMHIKVL